MGQVGKKQVEGASAVPDRGASGNTKQAFPVTTQHGTVERLTRISHSSKRSPPPPKRSGSMDSKSIKYWLKYDRVLFGCDRSLGKQA